MNLETLLVLFTCLADTTVLSSEDVKLNVTLGGELVIKADTPPPPDSSILWKINSNKVVEYDRDYPSLGIIPHGTFKGRVTLDRTTGELKVTSLTNTDYGVYSVEYDSKLQPKTFLVSVFIKTVPKPTIASSCDKDLTSCTLTCEGDTTDAGEVTYSWKKDGQPLSISKNTLQITSNEEFTCQLSNPVSKEKSEPLNNPLHQSGLTPGNIWAIIGVIGFVFVIAMVLVAILYFRSARSEIIRARINSVVFRRRFAWSETIRARIISVVFRRRFAGHPETRPVDVL